MVLLSAIGIRLICKCEENFVSVFSEYLDNYIKKSKYTVSRLASKMNMDRSILYRYVKGTRVPSDEALLCEIAAALCMTDTEKEHLLELYNRLMYGDEKIDNYVYFKSFLKQLKEREDGFITENGQVKTDMGTGYGHKMLWLNSEEEIVSVVRKLLDNVSNTRGADGEEKCIYIVMQPDNPVQEYIRPCLEDTDVRVEQIIHLERNDACKYKNLDVLLHILGTCFGNMHYTVYYSFCDDIGEGDSMYWMTNVIIIGDYVVWFDADMHYGSVIHDGCCRMGAMKRYGKIKKNTYILKNDTKQGDNATGIYGKTDGVIIGNLFIDPCIGLIVGRDIWESNLYDFEGKKELMDHIEDVGGAWNNTTYFPSKIIKSSKITVRFQYDGLIRFMETGRISELPACMYKPLDMPQRLLTLMRMIEIIKKGYFNYNIVDSSIEIPEKILIYRLENERSMSFSLIRRDASSRVVINEAGFGYIFDMFIEELERKGCIRNTEETLEILEEICGRYSVMKK